MLVAKLKKITAIVLAAFVLTAGVSAWRYAAAGPDAVPAPKEEAVRPVPRASREFQIDLKIVERKNGQEKLLAEPRLITLEDRPASFISGKSQTIELGGGKTEEVNIGTSVRAVVRAGEKGKVRLDAQVSHPTREIIGDDVNLETKTVRVLHDMELGTTTAFQMTPSEKPPSVLSIWVTIREVKPERKEKTIAPARVGQIFLRGNKKIADKFILKEVSLSPGQVLTFPELGNAEQRLKRLKGLKSAEVQVIDREGDSTFKDIQITVEEK